MTKFHGGSDQWSDVVAEVPAIAAPTCYLCGHSGKSLYTGERDRLYSAPGVWGIRVCPACDIAWLDPRPLPGAIPLLYDGYHTHKVASAGNLLRGLRETVGLWVLAARLGYRREAESHWPRVVFGWLASMLPVVHEGVRLSVMGLPARRRGRLLDVGCGNGVFLAKMRELGWSVVGVEPDSDAARIARERFGLTVFEGTLSEVQLPDGTADVVTMHHVIEHVPDPVEVLAECRRILNPGGLITVVTPNIRSLGRRVFGSSWRGWEVPRHVFIFSPRALRRCAELAGFKVIELWTSVRAARWMWQVSRLIALYETAPSRVDESLRWRLRFEGMAFQLLEWALARVGQFGEEIVLVGQK